MDVDQVREPELAREAVRPTEGLGREHGQMLDELRLAVTEQRLEQRVPQHAVVKGLFEPVQSLFAAGVLETTLASAGS